jgi:hypothetical protein
MANRANLLTRAELAMMTLPSESCDPVQNDIVQ